MDRKVTVLKDKGLTTPMSCIKQTNDVQKEERKQTVHPTTTPILTVEAK
jgi:hypothetical protein